MVQENPLLGAGFDGNTPLPAGKSEEYVKFAFCKQTVKVSGRPPYGLQFKGEPVKGPSGFS
jgi:hypothetical protein